jgi:hypothetical protein
MPWRLLTLLTLLPLVVLVVISFYWHPHPKPEPQPEPKHVFMGCEVLPRPPDDPDCIAIPDPSHGWWNCLDDTSRSWTDAQRHACVDVARRFERERPPR